MYKQSAQLYEHWHTPPSDIYNMPYYEFYYMLEDLNEILEAKAKANAKAQEDAQKQQKAQKTPRSLLGGFKLPSFKR